MSFSLKNFWGVGLRPHHYESWLFDTPPGKCTLEAISENYLYHNGGPALYYLDQLAERFPLVLHGVSLNFGSADPIDRNYIQRLKKLIKRVKPSVVSDHLSFSAIAGKHSHSLIPLPRDPKYLKSLRSRLLWLQDELDHPFTLENIPRYLQYKNNEMSEVSFIMELIEGTGAGLLMDVNNLYVTCSNEGSDPLAEIAKLKPGCVNQYHVAAHMDAEGFLYDTHSGKIKPEVWKLLNKAISLSGAARIVLERDDHEPLSATWEDWDGQSIAPAVESASRVNITTKLSDRYHSVSSGAAL